MNKTSKRIYLALITLGAMALLYFGWRLFWFLTDDAFIAFRYVANSLAGYGYVWNPQPFYPVEGYTSFLWVLLLDVIWRITGLAPTTTVNWLSLLFSALTLLVMGWALLRLKLSDPLHRYRLWFLALALIGTLTNRTFLAWTSSGLETALFNLLIVSWTVMAVMAESRGRRWMTLLFSLAVLAELTRPDGLLFLFASLVIAIGWFRSLTRARRVTLKDALTLLPLALPIIHLLWRKATYGEWLPNTYYAKFVAPWPEAGLKYFGSFVLEYALWIWTALLLWFAVVWLKNKRRREKFGSLSAKVAIGTMFVHLAYYTMIIGGDHFEYRVYSYLIPLIFLSTIWILNRVMKDPVIAACTVALFIVVSWLVPWTHWASTQDKWTEQETRKMFQPVAGKFPTGTRWYAESFDHLQAWLIDHSICARHQAHKAFSLRQLQRYPVQSLKVKTKYPLLELSAVGVAGWALPDVVMIDAMGLNDYVIARSEVPSGGKRTMAHERVPPIGYLQSFPVSCTFREDEGWGTTELETELTAREIIDNERFWRELIVEGGRPDIPATTLMRQGEFEARNRRYDNAVPLLSAAIERDSSLCGAYSLLAVCYVQLDQRDSAVTLIRGMSVTDHCSPLALTRLGRIAVEAGYGRAEEGDASAKSALRMGQQLLSQALAIDGGRADALVSMASVTLYRNRIDSSEIFLARLEQSNNLPVPQLEILAAQYRAKGRAELALRVESLLKQ